MGKVLVEAECDIVLCVRTGCDIEICISDKRERGIDISSSPSGSRQLLTYELAYLHAHACSLSRDFFHFVFYHFFCSDPKLYCVGLIFG